MRSGKVVPSLLNLCIQTAIDNVRYLGDVGETDINLLKDILPHCTVEQLAHIERSTEDRDLSPVTDELWKIFYERSFGVESVNLVVKRMKQKNVVFKWRSLFEAKSKEREEAQRNVGDKLKQRYAEEEKKRQSRQIQICSKVPPSSNKRQFFGGSGSSYNFSNVKGNLMKKAKLEYLNSHEARVHASMRKHALQRKTFPHQSVSRSTSTGSVLGKGSVSSSRPSTRK